MRFMLLVKASKDGEAGKPPTKDLMEAMGKFNEEMAKAGVLLAGEGIHPTSKGARVKFPQGRKPLVVHGPFPESRDLVAGFWMIEAKSLAEAVDWATKSPAPMGPGKDSEIEVRQVFEASDFPPESFPPEAAENEDALRDEIRRKVSKR